MHRCPQVWHARALELLRALIRVDTTNPPGNETEAAQLLQVALEPAGVQTQIIESAPGRGNLVARLRGSGEAPPLMLMGHLDVVPADASNWTYPPFAATVADDFVWGRGSTDMKQMIAMSAVILLCLAESAQTKGPLKRDIVLVATADEERGGRYGMRWLVNERPDLLDACCAINEGGGTPLQVGETLFFTCQTAEKGVCRSVWTACSKGGHGAYPREDLATLQLARGLARLGDGHLRSHVCATMRRALAIIAETQSDLSPRRVERLLARGKIEAALEAAGLAREVVSRFRALFNDTAAVTVLEAGQRGNVNVIPSVARAYVDGRILPGQTQVGYLELLRERAGDSVEIALHDGQ